MPEQSFDPHAPARPRRTPPSPKRLPLRTPEFERKHIGRLLEHIAELVEEYEWTEAMAYGQASSGGVGGGDIAYSDTTSSIALRGANSIIREYGGAPVDGERDTPSLSSLRAAMLDMERRIDQADNVVAGAITSLRKRNGSKNRISQPDPSGKGIGPRAVKESLAAQARRRDRGEGVG